MSMLATIDSATLNLLGSLQPEYDLRNFCGPLTDAHVKH